MPTTSPALDWLKTRVWPMEAAHTLVARRGGTASRIGGPSIRMTTVLTMETVHDTDAVFEALEPMGLAQLSASA
jgi:hypothetical protein